MPEDPTRKPSRRIETLFTILILGGLIGGMLWFKRGAPTPEGFSHITLAAANEKAQISDKPVVAVFTASWCGSCQSYKRGALADASVTQWINDNAIAVMIDIDTYPDDAQAAGITSVPTTVILRDGKILAASSGAQRVDVLLSWLDRTTAIN